MNFGSIVSTGTRCLIVILAIVVIFATLYLSACNPFGLGLPKDRELVAIFRANRGAFERIRTMAMEDAGTVSYLSEETLEKSFLSEARRSEYKQLLAISRKLTVGVSPRGVTFHFARGGVGLAIARSWTKGITYLRDGDEKGCVIMMNLDKSPAADGVYLVPIERNWYVVYSQLD